VAQKFHFAILQIEGTRALCGLSAIAELLVTVRQMQEKFRVKGKKLYFGFVDLEKAFDGVPREVIRWAMRKLGAEEWLVSAVMSTYTGAKTVVRTAYDNSSGFEVKVGMHQGSELSPLLFVIVMEAISVLFDSCINTLQLISAIFPEMCKLERLQTAQLTFKLTQGHCSCCHSISHT